MLSAMGCNKPQITLKGESLFDMWETGAKDLEKSDLGKLITAPIRLLSKTTDAGQKVLEATGKTAEAAPDIVKNIPLILIILAGGVTAYLVYAGKKGTKLIPGF